MAQKLFYGTGRRKTATSRTRLLYPGSGKVVINKRDYATYFTTDVMRSIALHALVLTENRDTFDVHVNVAGGGLSGQAEAVRHGIARALLEYDANLKPALKKAGLLTRDPRQKERKKPGLRGARKRPQYSKR